ncbi:chemotaxis protein CheB [Chitinophaga pendula]|uniref:chemotaxis protein CheB n=1 Tax=Chitinophaga TaxID=79328 RepID=UPI000BAFD5B3|nr:MULTISPECIES: chemotaxis protein CheB [Chitinophaga]ASZ13373.1 chemotaxis protein CheB [Chitinophaga sp. MD30]UCJ09005.1 chemotaxis protein CheB [Chitinophaga pendula]
MKADIRLLVIGGSAGSLDAILQILPGLDVALPLSIIIVLHRRNDQDSVLSDLLSAKTRLEVREVEEKDLLKPGVIYIAPSDYHLLVEQDHTLTLDYSEKLHYSRPSIDITFAAAADIYGAALACLLLSGANADGAAALHEAGKKGALTIVQDPADAEVPYMPQYALTLGKVAHVLKAAEMAVFINSLGARKATR